MIKKRKLYYRVCLEKSCSHLCPLPVFSLSVTLFLPVLLRFFIDSSCKCRGVCVCVCTVSTCVCLRPVEARSPSTMFMFDVFTNSKWTF